MPSFQISGLAHDEFGKLFEMSNEQLHALGAMRCIADESPGFQCRISLEDAAVGDELLLLPYAHHAVASPYRASGPIFVRRHVLQRRLEAGEVPPYVTRSLISVRAYDRQHSMVAAAVCEGVDVARQIQHEFDNPAVDYLHLHNAKQGCFACAVQRLR